MNKKTQEMRLAARVLNAAWKEAKAAWAAEAFAAREKAVGRRKISRIKFKLNSKKENQ